MTDPANVHCENDRCDPSALGLSVTETVWYLLDVTPDGIHPDQPEPAGEPLLRIVCLDWGCDVPITPAVRSALHLE